MDVTANQGLMAPSWDNGVVRLYHADARSIPLADESVHCVVTSPPYWNLRDYGLAPSVWGGDPECPHYWSEGVVAPGSRSSDDKSGSKQPNANRRDGMPTSAFCGKCGAWLGALGLEPTVDLYVSHIVEIFREVWRALRKDGTCWINLGDSYSGRRDGRLKPKDLVGMPWRIACALQGEGWWLRSPGIWEKPNPMPESVTDRLTTSHEYVFMLTKSGDRLYWAHPDRPGVRTKPPADYRYVFDETGEVLTTPPKGWRTKDSGWRRVNLWRGHDYYYDGVAIRKPYAEASLSDARDNQNGHRREQGYPGANSNGGTNLGGNRATGANARTVWTFSTRGYPHPHYATFPEALPERCILAGTSEHGVCARCGAPWERMVERTGHVNQREPAHAVNNCPTKTDSTGWAPVTRPTSQWQPTCACDASVVPATILDPFISSGTTAVAAQKLGRRAVGIDASEEYLRLAIKRVEAVSLPLPLGGGA